ncbi:hypothetical protein OPT61_g1052 [Boeremia exigua]|uniref:Uncharacterized protein n=1 Tax=Boeremia exigua TaxID=749465 RepID=A0ACC2IRQ1_9PLEO|nr:hypothetical protein OPT61_g1052 [Boeremia exigua]
MASPPPVEDQARLLEDALAVVRQQTMLMRRCLETPGKLMDALKCSSTLVSELRTSSLGPKQYYELYMAVFDALRHLAVYLRENHPVNHLADLYELVQYAGNIIPRLYLMITVGTVYMAIEDAPVKEIMKDMMEMSRGVQHPIRGLFLRYYLAGQARDHLPSGDSEGPEGNLQDSISFILTNFVEMNKLAPGIAAPCGQQPGQAQPAGRSRELQEDTQPPARADFVTQVFPDEFHLHTLDQFLSAVARLNPHVNVKGIVVGLMDRLSSYAQREAESESPEQRKKTEEESIAQLLERMRIAKEKGAEPEAAPTQQNGDSAEGDETRPSADETSTASSTTAVSLADTETAESEDAIEKRRGIPSNVKLFEIFHEQVQTLVKMQRLAIQDTIGLLVSLANLALNIYPERLDYIDQVLTFANQKVTEYQNSADLHSQATQSQILNLLLSPIKTYVSLFTALALPNYIPLLHSQPYPTRRAVAGEIARSLMRNKTPITSVENLESVLEILKVLIREGIQQAQGYPGGPIQRKAQETEETIEEQGWLARIVHLIHGQDNDTQFKLLQSARKAFSEGNERVRYTTPAIITASLKLARQYKKREHFDDNWQSQSSALYKFMHNTLSTLYSRVTGSADLSLRLFVACGQVADQNNFEEVAYEYFAQAFTVYEEAISDSRAQFQAVCVIASALHTTRNFGRENYDTLITKCALHGSKLLKKPDQCRAVYLASHLWWATELRQNEEDPKDLYRDGKRVLECLQRALRVADACMDAAVSVELFVEILNRYVYYFDQENDAVTTKYLNGLIELIHSNLQSNENASSLENPKKHFQRTLDYISSREYEGVITASK